VAYLQSTLTLFGNHRLSKEIYELIVTPVRMLILINIIKTGLIRLPFIGIFAILIISSWLIAVWPCYSVFVALSGKPFRLGTAELRSDLVVNCKSNPTFNSCAAEDDICNWPYDSSIQFVAKTCSRAFISHHRILLLQENISLSEQNNCNHF
jgi:hypothetical protein